MEYNDNKGITLYSDYFEVIKNHIYRFVKFIHITLILFIFLCFVISL